MKLFRTLFTMLVIGALGISMITLRPTKADFAEYYVSQNQTGLGDFFDSALEKVVMQRTDEKDCLFFSVFQIDGKDNYVGILGHFFGKSSAEEAGRLLENLVDRAEELLESYNNE